MDIFRLWASNALSNVAQSFFAEINGVGKTENAAAKRRKVEIEINDAVTAMVQRGDIYCTPQNPAQRRRRTRSTSTSMRSSMACTAQVEKTDVYALDPTRFCDAVKTGENTSQQTQQPRMHYGFNETNGVRRWMLNAALKLAHEPEMVEHDLNAPVEDAEIMANTISKQTLAADLEDTIVAAVAGLVVEHAPHRRQSTLYVVYNVSYDAIDILSPENVKPQPPNIVSGADIPEHQTRGIALDGLPPRKVPWHSNTPLPLLHRKVGPSSSRKGPCTLMQLAQTLVWILWSLGHTLP